MPWPTVQPITQKRTTSLTDRLLSIAEQIGVQVQYHCTGPKGWYSDSRQLISLRRDLGPVRMRCTLAHELAHAIRGDTRTGIRHFDERMERQTDRIAVGLLISEYDYREAEQVVGPHVAGLARELGVTQEVIRTWRTWYTPSIPIAESTP